MGRNLSAEGRVRREDEKTFCLSLCLHEFFHLKTETPSVSDEGEAGWREEQMEVERRGFTWARQACGGVMKGWCYLQTSQTLSAGAHSSELKADLREADVVTHPASDAV